MGRSLFSAGDSGATLKQVNQTLFLIRLPLFSTIAHSST